MQFSLPSKRQAARFLVVFYAATALLFFGFYTVMGIFGPLSLLTIYTSAVWPTTLIFHELHAALILVGLATALVEARVTGVGN